MRAPIVQWVNSVRPRQTRINVSIRAVATRFWKARKGATTAIPWAATAVRWCVCSSLGSLVWLREFAKADSAIRQVTFARAIRLQIAPWVRFAIPCQTRTSALQRVAATSSSSWVKVAMTAIRRTTTAATASVCWNSGSPACSVQHVRARSAIRRATFVHATKTAIVRAVSNAI